MVVLVTISLACAAVVMASEFRHQRLLLSLGRLAFASGHPRSWTWAAIPLRGLALGAIILGLLILWFDSGEERPDREPRRLIIALDVSPSMHITDSGASGRQSRGDRAREVARSILRRLGPRRYTVIAVYNGARPVVVDTWDRGVVYNILGDLPLEHGFTPGPTHLFSVLEEVETISTTWPSMSADLLIIADGDTASDQPATLRPLALGQTLIIGVGDAQRSSSVANRQSRQDRESLQHLAAITNGRYMDANRAEVPIHLLGQGPSASEPPARSQWALLLIGCGATLHLLLYWALATGGGAWSVQRFSYQESP